MRTDIITIGTEYLTGMIQESDSFYLAGRLAELDADIVSLITVGDDPDEVRNQLETALGKVDMILVTGAVGYGKNPAYQKIFADCFNREMTFQESAYDHMKKVTETRQLRISDEEIRTLAEFPEGAQILLNHEGLTCGFILTDGQKHLIVLPGSSREIKAVFEDDAVGYIYKTTALEEAELCIDLKTPAQDAKAGQAEDEILRRLGDLLESDNPEITLIKEEGECQIRIHAIGPTEGDASIIAWIAATNCQKSLGEDFAGEIRKIR